MSCPDIDVETMLRRKYFIRVDAVGLKVAYLKINGNDYKVSLDQMAQFLQQADAVTRDRLLAQFTARDVHTHTPYLYDLALLESPDLEIGESNEHVTYLCIRGYHCKMYNHDIKNYLKRKGVQRRLDYKMEHYKKVYGDTPLFYEVMQMEGFFL